MRLILASIYLETVGIPPAGSSRLISLQSPAILATEAWLANMQTNASMAFFIGDECITQESNHELKRVTAADL
jgi:hypothetical protein